MREPVLPALYFFFFLAEKIQVLVSFRFLAYSYTDPGTSIFSRKKKKKKKEIHNHHPHI